MEIIEWKDDLKLICHTAASFPEGIKKAFDILQQNIPNCEKRTWYGVSSLDENGKIIYKAAVNEMEENEANKCNFESFTITTGAYISETVKNWMSDPQEIEAAFKKILADPRMDRSFPCIEWYRGNDVICMARIVN